jgi:ribose transport system ATP-binding protein
VAGEVAGSPPPWPSPSRGEGTAPALQIRGLSKAFGGTRALDGVSLEVGPGEVHALVGQNGSGKSTLIKILSGYHAPDRGSVTAWGEGLAFPISAPALRRLGIAFVHQDLGLVDTMSVLENLRVGRYETGFAGHVRWRSEGARTRELLRRFDLLIDPMLPVGRLSRVERTIVAIVRALQGVEERPAALLVLDEPTASLPRHEVEILFETVRRVRDSGSSVIFVSHDMDEVFSIADRVTVLRDGRVVATRATAELDEPTLVALLVGSARPTTALPLAGVPTTSKDVVGWQGGGGKGRSPLLRVRGLDGSTVHGVSLEVSPGEVLGLTGLLGAGHDEVPYLVFGARRPRSGTVSIDGVELAPDPISCGRAGVALLPGDRRRLSGIPRATVRENVTIAHLDRFGGAVRLDLRRERTAVEQILDRFDVRPREPERPLFTLSGGNQQKALLARCLAARPRLLLLHEPTQGVDVGARASILAMLRDAAEAGTAIVYASSEHQDLAQVCDRVIVFRRGRPAATLAGDALTPESILAHCYRNAAAAS